MTIFTKYAILDVRQGSQYASGPQTTVDDWGNMGRVVTQLCGRAFDFFLSLQKPGREFGRFCRVF